MSSDQLDAALHAFCQRRPFRSFLIEFTSGAQVLLKHPEAIRRQGVLYVLRFPDHGFSAFGAESVARILDDPNAPAT